MSSSAATKPPITPLPEVTRLSPAVIRILGGNPGKGRGRGYPGHGLVVEDGPAKIGEYIRHRQQREDQVIETLRAFTAKEDHGEGWTPMELVKVIYQGVPEGLHIPAAGGVIQILNKLRKEGKVTAVDGGDRWRLIDRSAL
ncbi:unnamed protein product [Sordaria macrospora k-hell]|uniref:WGS project CABT00000000 data, contig 2.9 n=1 Tax=Sordaria macrospora (strain ATCC MYA-333 / DSM 997 / K(L3346) / K-hell) TaxID=771870 RepID=F7VVD7_SORMK|nr:uncharacterized protein SMAC_03508 [Sordaria macrospora k-hell]CCC09478.1 unnamed protein product [Sordaria macrospora k-hell]